MSEPSNLDRPAFIETLQQELALGAESLRQGRQRRQRGGLAVIGVVIIGLMVVLVNAGRGQEPGSGSGQVAAGQAQSESQSQSQSQSQPGSGSGVGADADADAPEADERGPTTSAEQAPAGGLLKLEPLGDPISSDDRRVVHDLQLTTGERLRLELPLAMAGAYVVRQNAAPEPIVIEGDKGRLTIDFPGCPDAVPRCDTQGPVRLSAAPSIDLSADQQQLFAVQVMTGGSRHQQALTSIAPELAECGNCSPWGPLTFPNRNLVINLVGRSTVVGFDRDRLEERWRVRFEQPVTELAATGDGVHAAITGGPVVKLDLDGERQWQIERVGGEERLHIAGRFMATSFTGPDDNRAPLLRRFDPLTGEVDWTVEGRVGADWQLTAPLVHANTLMLVDVTDPGMTGPPQAIVAFDLVSGERRWRLETEAGIRKLDHQLLTNVDLEDGRAVLARTPDGQIMRLDPRSGRIIWRSTIADGRFNGTEFDADGDLALDIISPSGRILLDPASGRPADAADQPPPFSCPVTSAPAKVFVPPAPWPERPSVDNSVWYGSEELWTVLQRQGHQPRKSVWWSANFPGGGLEPNPELRVVYQRLDVPAAPLVFPAPGTNAYDRNHHFMINGLEPDEQGCWQATASYKGASLSYVYEVD